MSNDLLPEILTKLKGLNKANGCQYLFSVIQECHLLKLKIIHQKCCSYKTGASLSGTARISQTERWVKRLSAVLKAVLGLWWREDKKRNTHKHSGVWVNRGDESSASEIKLINQHKVRLLVQSSAGHGAGTQPPDANQTGDWLYEGGFALLCETLSWRSGGNSLFITVPGVFSAYWTGPVLSADSPRSSSFCSTSCHTAHSQTHTGRQMLRPRHTHTQLDFLMQPIVIDIYIFFCKRNSFQFTTGHYFKITVKIHYNLGWLIEISWWLK